MSEKRPSYFVTVDPVERRKAWSRDFIQRAPDGPMFGSPEWCELEEGPVKWAAVVRAAECWLTEAEDALTRLRDQHVGAAMEAKRDEDAEYAQRRDEHRSEWSQTSWRPHPANRRESPARSKGAA